MTVQSKGKPTQRRLNNLLKKQNDRWFTIKQLEKEINDIQEDIWKIYEAWNKKEVVRY